MRKKSNEYKVNWHNQTTYSSAKSTHLLIIKLGYIKAYRAFDPSRSLSSWLSTWPLSHLWILTFSNTYFRKLQRVKKRKSAEHVRKTKSLENKFKLEPKITKGDLRVCMAIHYSVNQYTSSLPKITKGEKSKKDAYRGGICLKIKARC